MDKTPLQVTAALCRTLPRMVSFQLQSRSSSTALPLQWPGPKSRGRPPLVRDDDLVEIRDCPGVHLTEEPAQRGIQLVERPETLAASQIAQMMALIG